jgi:hypothetical protein
MKDREEKGAGSILGMLVLFLVIIGLGIFVVKAFIDANTTKVDPGELITESMEEIGELAVYEWDYTTSQTIEDSYWQIFGVNIPWTNKTATLTGSATIKFGINLDGVTYTVDSENKSVDIDIDQISILSHELDEESFEYDIDDNFLNRVSEKEKKQLRIDFKKYAEENIPDSVYKKAKDKVKSVIISGLSEVVPDYDIEVNFADELTK